MWGSSRGLKIQAEAFIYMVPATIYSIHPYWIPEFSSPSTTERLAIGYYDGSVDLKIEEPSPCQTLLMTGLRTVTSINCIELPFILALDLSTTPQT